MASNRRSDHQQGHRGQYDRNRQRILMTQDTCGICGQPIDKSIKWPEPGAPVVDHIIPINRGGHPSAIENLQLCHNACNRQKSDKMYLDNRAPEPQKNVLNLPLSIDWASYTSEPDNSEKLYENAERIRADGNELYAAGVKRKIPGK